MKALAAGLSVVFLSVMMSMLPVAAQEAEQTFNFVCEIDPTPLNLGLTTSIFTFDSRRLCTGVASARNVKIECSGIIPNWPAGTTASASDFVCTMNGDACGLSPLPGDSNAPYLTATDSSLTVDGSGLAELVCFYKPE